MTSNSDMITKRLVPYLGDKSCPECGITFHPRRSTSKYCSNACKDKNNGKNQAGRGIITEAERFWMKVNQTETCWIWKAAIRGRYGAFRFQDKKVLAHRWAYENLVGPIPEGLTIDHLCKVTLCVNPAHLEAVTMRENLMRSDNPIAAQVKRTHCPQGHPYDGHDSSGSRICRTCRKAQQAAYRNRKVGATL